MKRKCITCKGEGKITDTCPHCGEDHTCTCPDCGGTGKLPFNPLMLCEECGKTFSCPLTEKGYCKNSKSRGKAKYRLRSYVPKVPYRFKVKSGELIRMCVCENCTSLDEWKPCSQKDIKRKKLLEEEIKKDEKFNPDLAGLPDKEPERPERRTPSMNEWCDPRSGLNF